MDHVTISVSQIATEPSFRYVQYAVACTPYITFLFIPMWHAGVGVTVAKTMTADKSLTHCLSEPPFLSIIEAVLTRTEQSRIIFCTDPTGKH